MTIVALSVASCGQGEADPPVSVPEISTVAPALGSQSSTTITEPPGNLLPLIGEVIGEAPVRLASPAAPTVYLTSDHSGGSEIEAPAGLVVELTSCALVGPGVLAFETVLSGDGVTYPFAATVETSIISGDVGSGLWGVGRFEAPGRQLIVASVPAFAEGLERDWGEPDGTNVGRELRWGRRGQRCALTVGSLEAEETHDLEQVFGALEITAPDGTVEALAQQAFGKGTSAALFPLAVAYGDATDFYADRWFLPTEPEVLERISEDLSRDLCLEVEFRYESYTITQRKGCPSIEREPVYQAGTTWFATGSDGVWLVEVASEDRAVVEEVMGSLRPAWHLYHREIPLTPLNEREIGRAPFQGGEVLVTMGEQRCTGNCQSPEGWFFVYRIVGTSLEEYANYPGWDGCLLAEEEPFVLAVAPRFGRVEISDSSGTAVIEYDGERPFAFIDRAASSTTVEIFDQSGGTPGCVIKREGDARGGVEPAGSGTPDAPGPETSRTVEAGTCGELPQYLFDFTDTDPIRVACANSTGGVVTLVQLIPNEMMADPPDGLDCIVAFLGRGSSASCWQIGSDPEAIQSGTDVTGMFASMVPDGTTRIVGVTTRGTELIGIPHDRLALVWWRSVEGDLRSVMAEGPYGLVVLYD